MFNTMRKKLNSFNIFISNEENYFIIENKRKEFPLNNEYFSKSSIYYFPS